MRTIDAVIESLRTVGDYLVPCNFPLQPKEVELDTAFLKTMENVEADGYTVTLYYNRSKYENIYRETFQIFSQHGAFLPFNLVVKLAKKMLGGHCLTLTEFYLGGSKVYCWTVITDLGGHPFIMDDKKTQKRNYEGFMYSWIHPANMTFH